MSGLSERSRLVAEALAAAGAEGEVRELPDSARTAAEAAAALGCEVGGIANSLVFDADGSPLLVMTSGQAIGRVAPVGHPSPLETVVHQSLAGYDVLWAAGGTPHTVFPTTYRELLAITGGKALQIN